MSSGIVGNILNTLSKKVKPFSDIGQAIMRIINRIQRGHGKKPNIISVNFPIHTKYNTPAKRLRFIRKLSIEPMKRQHKTPNFFKYRIKEANKNKKHFTKKISDVNVIFEI